MLLQQGEKFWVIQPNTEVRDELRTWPGSWDFLLSLQPSCCAHTSGLVAGRCHYCHSAENVCVVREKSTAGCQAHSSPKFEHTVLSGLQRGDCGGRKGIIFLQFYSQSSQFQMWVIPKAVTVWESCPSTAPSGGNHPNAQTPSKGFCNSLSSAAGFVQRDLNELRGNQPLGF